jgi:large subunit ribosomal protein L15
MNLGSLKPAEGSIKKRKRVGRGGAHGGTSCRGHKGYYSRSGARVKLGFEGGQTPIQRRIPKRGFTNIFKKKFQTVNLSDLEKLNGEREITPSLLYEKGLISKKHIPVKILGDGEISWAAEIFANAFSKSAQEKIESAKGRVNILC